MADQGQSGFLPPQPPGPEPDLGDTERDPTQPLPPTAQTQPLPAQGYPPPQTYPQPPPQPQAWQPPHGYGPPPGYGYGPPPGYYPPPQGWPQPQLGWAPPPSEPGNTPAVAGFALSVTGGGLLFVSAGFSSVLSLGLSIAGLIYSRKGRRMVDEGKTRKQRDLAQAGYVIGIISTILSVLATAFWLLFLILAITDESFQRQLENGNSGTIAIGVVKGITGLLT